MCHDCNLYANYLQQHGINMPNADVKGIFHGNEKVNKHASVSVQSQGAGNYSAKPLYAGPMKSSKPTGYSGSNVTAASTFTTEYATTSKESSSNYTFFTPESSYSTKGSVNRYVV